MRPLERLLTEAVRDQRGSESMEYALVVGLIIATAMAVFTALGSRIFHQ